jgi:excisionase family DNA binding protein
MKSVLSFLLVVFYSCIVNAQIIFIKDVNSKPIPKASVSVQIIYKSTEFLLEGSQEKFFTAVTDTLGKLKLFGEYSKEEFLVESITIKVQHKEFETFEVTTKEYLKSPTFSYTIYLVPKNSKVNLSGKIISNRQEVNDLEIYSVSELASKLNVKEEDIVDLIKKKKLKGKKIGEKYFVSAEELRKFLDE